MGANLRLGKPAIDTAAAPQNGRGGRSSRLTANTRRAEPSKIPYRNSATMVADALRQSAYAAAGLGEAKETTCPRQSADAQVTTASRRCTPVSRRANPATPAVGPGKTLPALLLAALNEPVFVTIDRKRRKITKREVIVTRMVSKAAGGDLRATKMLIDMMKDIEREAGAAAPPEPRRFAPTEPCCKKSRI